MRAMGTVYWQAEFRGRPAPNVIKAVVGEDWILERTPSGELAFVLLPPHSSGFGATRAVSPTPYVGRRTPGTVLRSSLRLGTRARCD